MGQFGVEEEYWSACFRGTSGEEMKKKIYRGQGSQSITLKQVSTEIEAILELRM